MEIVKELLCVDYQNTIWPLFHLSVDPKINGQGEIWSYYIWCLLEFIRNERRNSKFSPTINTWHFIKSNFLANKFFSCGGHRVYYLLAIRVGYGSFGIMLVMFYTKEQQQEHLSKIISCNNSKYNLRNQQLKHVLA